MKRSVVILGVVGLLVAAVGGRYLLGGDGANAEAGASAGRGGGAGRGGRGAGARLPITVEMATVQRGSMDLHVEVVGNLIGLATVEATPKVAGRLESVSVHLGDRVSRGQVIAKVEDREINEQVKQAQAAHEVSAATIRQREADLRLAETNLERSRNLFERGLIPRQTLDDTDARHQAAVAQLDLARAQFSQASARLEELRINLSNTVIISPVSGFIARRLLDPGGWVTPASAFVSVVDISAVRMVANIVEKDIRLMSAGLSASVEVDAFPGEKFEGKVARVAPVLDPLTRTAQIEIEIPNGEFRLKPGMYARVTFVADRRENALVIPIEALVDAGGKRGVYVPQDGETGQTAHFQEIEVGWVQDELVEVISGVSEGDRIVTTGAAALREGDVMLLPGEAQGGRGGAGGRATGRGEGRGSGGRGGGGEQ